MVVFRQRLRELKNCRTVRCHDPRHHRTLFEDGEIPVERTERDALRRTLQIVDRQRIFGASERLDEFAPERRVPLLA